MSLCDIKTAIEEINAGQMIILVDDENRENEGDLIIAAEKISAEAINFMAKEARGLICLAMSGELVDKLNLPAMTTNNRSRFTTNFTVSIEARNGVSTGISAADRATTILAAVNDDAKPEDIVTPGHIFPLRAKPDGVLERKGHTEGSVDLAKLAGLKAGTVICEIINDDGTMARLPDLEKFAQKYDLKICSISDLIKFRLRHDRTIIKRISSTKLPTAYGGFTAVAYESSVDAAVHLALINGKLDSTQPILTRLHSECLTGDVFGSKRCDCGQQLQQAMQLIAEAGTGVILYLRQEGRGIGLANKIKAYELQDNGLDTVTANHALGFADDLRDYGIAAQILLDLGIKQLRLLTNNPKKIAALHGDGLEVVERVPLQAKSNSDNEFYLKTKKEKMQHLL
jgi:3,4-dihydroxy 2-butanone 4-phosphate synthase / GTP cyclohydrolase II